MIIVDATIKGRARECSCAIWQKRREGEKRATARHHNSAEEVSTSATVREFASRSCKF